MRAKYPMRPDFSQVSGRVALAKSVVWLENALTDPDFDKSFPVAMGWRRLLGVPMLREGEPVGVIVVGWAEPGPPSKVQEELLKTFADQAVIAIENTRLFNELRESLEQQTATSEVLKVISSSPGELEPVFKAMLENAVHICEAKFGTMLRAEERGYRVVAMHGPPPAYAAERQRNPVLRVGPTNPLARVAASKQLQHIADIRTERAYLDRDPAFVVLADDAGARTLLMVPMLKENNLVGAIAIYRQEVRPFTEKQIELLQNFAAQAVIAIENTRLLNELRESLQQQTATADVLKVISSSPGKLEPVFGAMLENATRICEAKFGILFLSEGDTFRTVALYGAPPAFAEARRREPVIRAGPGISLHRAATTMQPVQVADIRAEPAYTNDPQRFAILDLAGARTMLSVPMLKDDRAVGVISIYRQEVRPFTDKQIELVKNFAAQAVIAIENTRLLNELRQRTDDLSESLEQQVATSDVLRVISSSPTDVQPVFDSIAESAVRLCDGQFSFVIRFDGKVMDFASCCGLSAEGLDAFHSILPMPASEDTAAGRAIVRRAVVEIPDVEADPSYGAQGRGLAKAVNYRSIAAVPLLNEGNPIGAIAVARANAGSFPKRQIVLLQAFADQAVIAIKNVRLFDEVQARTRDLAKSLEELRTTQDRLVQTQKLALLGQLTAGIAHEIKNPLNFVNNFSGVSSELIDELQDTLKGIPFDDKARSDINELTDTLRSNLEKVVQHGKRADAIVKNMLQHSREGSGEHRVVDINALVEESLNLAWHGARAEKQGFDIALKRSFDPSAGEADIFPQDITRALLNVISNGFYAATQRKAEMSGGEYAPTIAASTKNLGDRVEIRIRDNGTGIPPDVKEKMFNPFFTTKPTGEGTGLGLSISHDIIVKQHGGSIEVDTQPGEFSEIRVILPRVAALLPDRS